MGTWRLFCDEHKKQPLVWLFVFVFTVLAGIASILSYVSSRTATPVTQPGPSSTKQVRPYIFTRLVIDSVTRDRVDFHFQVENGEVPIRNVQVSYGTAHFTEIEVKPYITRMLPPGGKLSVPGRPSVFTTGKRTNLIAYVTYNAQLNGSDKDFWFMYRFLVHPHDLKPQMIEPEGIEEHEGVLNPQDLLTPEKLEKALAEPKGYLVFPLYELGRDGKPAVIETAYEPGKRRFSLNAYARTVSWEMTTNSGRLIKLETALPRTEDGLHDIILEWDYPQSTLGLYVDGIEKQYDPKSNPKM